MNRKESTIGMIKLGFAAICLSGVLLALPAVAADDIPYGFDSGGEKIFTRYNETPLAAITGTDGRRNLNSFYELRQYPGSPPRIPHKVFPSFSIEAEECLACHGRGGYDVELDAYAPVTPHPENELCYQCHVPKLTDELFVENNWLSVSPPRLGMSQLGGSPPPIPHSLQLRDDCIACHTGSAAVAEIRVDHATRGNCRQCHVPFLANKPALEFTRNK
jgi:cytochrome c-type protein NapB